MFSKDVIDTDNFLEMPATTQVLYFHLSMRADDDGFVSNPKRILRLTGCSEDDLKILYAKKFIIPFESGVCVIRHWKIHNYIQKDRYNKTIYHDELDKLTVLENGMYEMVDTECIQDVSISDTQVRLGKDSLGKVSQVKDSLELGEYRKEKGLTVTKKQGVQMYDKSTPELEKELELNKEKDIPHSTNADTQSKKQEDSESMKQARFLSQFLFDECRRIDEKFGIGKDRVTVDRWAKDIEKLIRIDKRTFYEVKEVIAWAKSHHFWTANIMSGVKLREQFPRLYTQMRKEKQDEEKKRPKTREEIYAEMVARYGESQ